MELGTLLVIFAIALAVVSFFVPVHIHRLLAASVVLMGIGVLVGVGSLTT